MKVLHLLYSDSFSGAENVACQIIQMMSTQPDLHMAYCSRDGQIKRALKQKEIEFYPLTDFTIQQIKKVIAQYKPDVIHAHDMRASVAAAFAIKPGIRIVSHIHNSDFVSRKLSVKSLLYWLANMRISKVLWVSESCFEGYYFHELLKKKSVILPNVIDADAVSEKAMSDQREFDYDIVYVGRLADPKNPLRLIEILKMVQTQKADLRVGIVGSGDLEDITHQAAEAAGLMNNIVFHGFEANPLKILKSAKVMVMTSDREGTPMVCLEAMALGVPIVSTPTDGLCDLVQPGITGYLENDNQIFASRLLSLITDETLRQRFSAATLKEFSKINDIENYRKVLCDAYV